MTTVATAAGLGLVSCPACRLLSSACHEGISGCPRCGVPLRARKPESLERTTAFVIAATLLFFPANLLPVMTTVSLLGPEPETIMSGVIRLWKDGAWDLAILIFSASIVVPALKIVALAMLIITTRRRSTWRPRFRTHVYRALEHIGRWSMLDIFVMGLLAALARSRQAAAEINPGAIAFAAVVVLTMFSSRSFDPRLIWDTGKDRRE